MMLRTIKSKVMGRSNLGWLNSWFHFSFAEYYNPDNMRYGHLRVLNDDLIQPGAGFAMHPHQDMEIITYVVQGKLTHEDSMGNRRTLARGDVQYMSAGTGVTHSEYNWGKEELRLLQIWITPDHAGHVPHYGEHRFPWDSRQGQWLELVSGVNGTAPVKIHQEIHLYVTALQAGERLSFTQDTDCMYYLVEIEGEAGVNGLVLRERDAMELSNENIEVNAHTKAHLMLFELTRK